MKPPIPLTPPFTRKHLGADHYPWSDDLVIAHSFAAEHGLQIELVFADYQIARLHDDEVRLLVYPHRTKSTGNRHARVRDEGSKNPRRAHALMALLDQAAGYNCTFSFHGPNNPEAEGFLRSLPADRELVEAAARRSAGQ